MSDGLPLYWSQAYVAALVKALNVDPDFQKAAAKFQNSTQLRCLDSPEGEDVVATYAIDRGGVTVKRYAEASPSSTVRNEPFDKKALFARTTAPMFNAMNAVGTALPKRFA